ncbi:MAG: phosphate/phosphite/phosphonate ABC transporter substrate-binding protein [Myxococcaceae bacterium]
MDVLDAGSMDVRLGLPPSLPVAAPPGGLARLRRVLSGALGRAVELVVAPDDERLVEAARSGRVDAVWAPPLACARLEALGARVLARAVRHGALDSRAVLLTRTDGPEQLAGLPGTRVAWVDRASLAGYLLPAAALRAAGHPPERTFFQQTFYGSFRAALDALLAGEADVAAMFASPSGDDVLTGAEEVAPGSGREVRALLVTGRGPLDAIAAAPSLAPADGVRLQRGLLGLAQLPEGPTLLRDVFRAERFTAAPPLGYRALLGLTLAVG